MSVPSQEISNQNDGSRPDKQEDMDTSVASSDQGKTSKDANVPGEDVLSQVSEDEGLHGKEQKDMDTGEAFNDQGNKDTSAPEEDVLSQVFREEEDPAVENEQDDGGEEKSDDEDEEDDTEPVKPYLRFRIHKDVPTDQFEDYEFGEMAGDTGQKVTNMEDLENLQEASEKWTPSNSSATAVMNNTRRFVCIDYPGVVKNTEKAMATLGGVTQIAQARKTETKLELHFRPDEPFCKPTLGSCSKTGNLLIKCKRRKAPSDSPSSSQGDGFEYKIEVLGIVDAIFNFDIPADYQFLPVVKNKDGSKRNLLDDIILKFEDQREDYLSRDVPLFVPPFSFARHEKPASYTFQPDVVDDEADDCAYSSARKSRALGTQCMSFRDKEVPKEPLPESVENLRKFNEDKVQACVELLNKLFEKRPLWTRLSMMANMSSQTHLLLKHALPTLAYYHLGGPWRHAWCRLGYDPRAHPEAKHYQVIEIRIRANVKMTKIKATTFGFHRKSKVTPKQEPAIENRPETSRPENAAAGTSSGEATPTGREGKYQFLPSKLPPQRHMFYQVCDIMEDRVQLLAHQNDGQETECTERDGWCVPDFTSTSRDILAACIENLIS